MWTKSTSPQHTRRCSRPNNVHATFPLHLATIRIGRVSRVQRTAVDVLLAGHVRCETGLVLFVAGRIR